MTLHARSLSFRKRRGLSALLLGLAFVSVLCADADAGPTDEAVRECVSKAVEKLKSGQKADGHWETVANQYGGMTALAVLALLQAGEPLDDPAVAGGLEALERVPNVETYVVSLRTMAMLKAGEIAGRPLYAGEIRRAVDWLERAQTRLGTWGYRMPPQEDRQAEAIAAATDNSNTQFALLALHEAARGGYAIDERIWKRSRDYYVRTQLSDGGWGYRHEGRSSSMRWPAYGSMTSAGLASLLITGARLRQGADCGCGDDAGPKYLDSQPAAQALGWLRKRFTVQKNPGLPDNRWHFYYFYALERVGIVSGLERIGGHDWFSRGAEYLLGRQLADGGFARAPERGGIAPEYDTAFAILFLTKGHVPVLVNKLRWSERRSDWHWNLYDAENLTRWIGTRLNGRPVTWQSVSPSDPLERWLKAPLLLVTGRKAPRLSDAAKKKLLEYVRQGGTVLAVACCGSEDFSEGVRELTGELFAGYALEPLPESHPVYHSAEDLSPRWPLEGVNYGCRTSFFLSTGDLSCAWELAGKEDEELGLKMGLNLAAYATGLQPLPDRLSSVRRLDEVPETQVGPMALALGKVRHHGRD